MDNQFYMTLSSNASMAIHPDNTVAEFITTLSSPMELRKTGWSVALVELIYPCSYYHIPKGEYIKFVKWSSHSARYWTPFPENITIEEGFYDSPKQLAEQVIEAFEKAWEKYKGGMTSIINSDAPAIIIMYNEKTNKLKVGGRVGGYGLYVSPLLADILGLRQLIDTGSAHVPLPYVCESETEIDLMRGKHMVFLYCSLIDDCAVGDTKAPLLRSTTMHGKRGTLTKETFVKPYYHPLKTLCFDTIEISMRSETASVIPFNAGHSVLTLHFKRDALA